MHKSITELLELIMSSASPSGEVKMSFLNRGRIFPVSSSEIGHTSAPPVAEREDRFLMCQQEAKPE